MENSDENFNIEVGRNIITDVSSLIIHHKDMGSNNIHVVPSILKNHLSVIVFPEIGNDNEELQFCLIRMEQLKKFIFQKI